MICSASASSERRRVHHRDFSQASVLFNPKAGEEKEEGGGRQRGGDRWKRGELSGESEAD